MKFVQALCHETWLTRLCLFNKQISYLTVFISRSGKLRDFLTFWFEQIAKINGKAEFINFSSIFITTVVLNEFRRAISWFIPNNSISLRVSLWKSDSRNFSSFLRRIPRLRTARINEQISNIHFLLRSGKARKWVSFMKQRN